MQFLDKNVTNIGICYGMDHLFSYQLILDITYNYPLNGQQDWTSQYNQTSLKEYALFYIMQYFWQGRKKMLHCYPNGDLY